MGLHSIDFLKKNPYEDLKPLCENDKSKLCFVIPNYTYHKKQPHHVDV